MTRLLALEHGIDRVIRRLSHLKLREFGEGIHISPAVGKEQPLDKGKGIRVLGISAVILPVDKPGILGQISRGGVYLH